MLLRGVLLRDDEISVTDAAEVIGVSRYTVWSWCRKGLLKYRRRRYCYAVLLPSVLAIVKKATHIERLKKAAAIRRGVVAQQIAARECV